MSAPAVTQASIQQKVGQFFSLIENDPDHEIRTDAYIVLFESGLSDVEQEGILKNISDFGLVVAKAKAEERGFLEGRVSSSPSMFSKIGSAVARFVGIAESKEGKEAKSSVASSCKALTTSSVPTAVEAASGVFDCTRFPAPLVRKVAIYVGHPECPGMDDLAYKELYVDVFSQDGNLMRLYIAPSLIADGQHAAVVSRAKAAVDCVAARSIENITEGCSPLDLASIVKRGNSLIPFVDLDMMLLFHKLSEELPFIATFLATIVDKNIKDQADAIRQFMNKNKEKIRMALMMKDPELNLKLAGINSVPYELLLLRLELLNLSENEIFSIPESFCQMHSLRSLNLSYNETMITLPDSFGNLPNLEALHLCGMRDMQTLPACLLNLPKLNVLFTDSRLANASPEVIKALKDKGCHVVIKN